MIRCSTPLASTINLFIITIGYEDWLFENPIFWGCQRRGKNEQNSIWNYTERGTQTIIEKRISDDPLFYHTFNPSCPDGKLNPPLSHGLQWNRIILACYQLNYEGPATRGCSFQFKSYGKDKKKLIQISCPYPNTIKTCNRIWRSAMAITLLTFMSWQVICNSTN